MQEDSSTNWDMHLTTVCSGDSALITVLGQVVLGKADDLVDEIENLLSQGCRYFQIDLRNADYIDSSGLSCLLRCHWLVNKQNEHGMDKNLKIIFVVGESIGEALHLVQLDNYLEVRTSLEKW